MYFLPPSEWVSKLQNATTVYKLPVEFLSFVDNGFATLPYPYTKSHFYTDPYCLYLKPNHSVVPNYYDFTTFSKSNLEMPILALLEYDEEYCKHKPFYQPNVVLPFLNVPTFNNIVEFYLLDSKKKSVKLADHSQLFVSLEIN